MNLLEVRNLTKVFGDVVAVQSADLHVAAGEVVGLLGANGAGKTTLIRVALGLLHPSEGEVALFGEPPGLPVRRRLGYVPQGLGLYGDLTVGENLQFVARAYGVPSRGRVGGGSDQDRLVADLPLGVRRRVAFEAAFLHHPELLVLDEPTSGVGPLARTDLWESIRAAAERGTGVLVTTHHLSEAEECDRVVLMAAGRVVATGTVKELVAGAWVVEVKAGSWSEVFTTLSAAGYSLALRGRRVRAVEADIDEVAGVLERNGIAAELSVEEATFEEAFVTLTAAA